MVKISITWDDLALALNALRMIRVLTSYEAFQTNRCSPEGIYLKLWFSRPTFYFLQHSLATSSLFFYILLSSCMYILLKLVSFPLSQYAATTRITAAGHTQYKTH